MEWGSKNGMGSIEWSLVEWVPLEYYLVDTKGIVGMDLVERGEWNGS